jgi:hypothetical protein
MSKSITLFRVMLSSMIAALLSGEPACHAARRRACGPRLLSNIPGLSMFEAKVATSVGNATLAASEISIRRVLNGQAA